MGRPPLRLHCNRPLSAGRTNTFMLCCTPREARTRNTNKRLLEMENNCPACQATSRRTMIVVRFALWSQNPWPAVDGHLWSPSKQRHASTVGLVRWPDEAAAATGCQRLVSQDLCCRCQVRQTEYFHTQLVPLEQVLTVVALVRVIIARELGPSHCVDQSLELTTQWLAA